MQAVRDETMSWRWRDAAIDLGISFCGEGPTVVMLPALSSISTRREMAPLQQRLAPHYRTIAVDWPGFGDLPRPAIDWTPAAYAAYLAFVLDTVARKPTRSSLPAMPRATRWHTAATIPTRSAAWCCSRRHGGARCRP
jgi:pimeloyl-ACP methyl ester carboxylesterase